MAKKYFVLFFLTAGLILPVFSMAQTGSGTTVQQKVPLQTVAKCGVNTFRIENECGAGVYKNMYVQCYDGYEEKQGGESSCKSSEVWQSYAKEACQKRCFSNTGDNKPVNTAKPIIPIKPVPTTSVSPTSKQIPAAAPAILNAAPQSAVARCYSDQKITEEYNVLLVELKNAESQGDKQKQETIKGKISSLKNTVSNLQQKCVIGTASEKIPQVKAAGTVDRCVQLEQWEEKIKYYEKLAALDEALLKKEASFSPNEVKEIILKLRSGYEEAKRNCVTKAERETKVTATGEAVMVKPVNPVSPASREEIDTYYREKMGTITGAESADSQIRDLKELKKEISALATNLIKSRKEVEAAELDGLVEEIKMKPGEIEIGDNVISAAEKKVFIEIGKKALSVEPAAKQVMIKDKDINVEAEGEISIKGNKLMVGSSEVKIAPSEITAKLNIVSNAFVLKEENNGAVYEIKTDERRKLFGFIPFSLSKTITANAGDGSVLKEKLPWYSFITTR